MKILDCNAAEQLFEKAKSLANKPHNSWRCIHMNLDREQRLNAGRRAQFVVPTLIGLLEDTDGYIYLCDDGDIFILFQGPMKPVMSKLTGYFKDLTLWPIWDQPENSPFTVFDFSRHWHVFFHICRVKSMQSQSATA